VVGIVVVSHSSVLAEGVVELAREMGGPDVPLEPAGGLEEQKGVLGTDAEFVRRAIERARSDDGVLVLMDLGSAVMSAEMAAEMLEPDGGGRVMLCEAPLVEGAVAGAAAAAAGRSLDQVAAEARDALRMKATHLAPTAGQDGAPGPEPPAPEAGEGFELRLTLRNQLGLHARPAARFVRTAGRFDAELSVTNLTRGTGPASARSLTALATLGARQGDEIRVLAQGEQAEAALRAIDELAGDNFGDVDGSAPVPPAPAAPAEPRPTAAPPASHDRLTGVPAAPGIAVGPARLVHVVEPELPNRPAEEPDAEWGRLEQARLATRRDLQRDRASVAQRAGEAEAGIFDAHLLMLEDDALLEPARRAVFEQQATAERAWRDAAAGAASEYDRLDDPYQRGRGLDVLDVSRRVLGHLVGNGSAELALTGPGVLVAPEITPGQAAALDRGLVRGIATAHGGATSHAAILARSLGIPAVVGLGEGLLALDEGTPLVLDGAAGAVDVDPPPELLEAYERRREAEDTRGRDARVKALEAAQTRDGRRIDVMANLGGPDEVDDAVALGAEGVGLLRTEFLFLGRDTLPGEEEQLAAYQQMAKALAGRPLIIRTLDVGADKPLPYLSQEPEANPFLGRRGIRLSLAQPELFRTQLRAIVRAAAEHPVKVMFPMVAALQEYRSARALVEEVRQELGAAGDLDVGVMVEVPSVALAAERFAAEVDFLSIGTNDLAQYTMAAERGNEHLAGLIDGPLPALLRLVHDAVRGAEAHGRWVGVCGELAGDPAAAAVLVGLGVTELSMAPPLIPDVKQALRGVDFDAARRVAEEALACDGAAEVRELAATLLEPGRAAGRNSAP
jgi:phosphoenolpyruvate-protein phosphotransferase/dihydroxyacetone kinase phosphotransfer subunit